MSGVRVLVVDDDLELLRRIGAAFTNADFEVSLAADGAVALKRLQAADFDLVLTDIIMPNREGIETLLEIKRRWPHVKVIAMSGGGRIGAEEFLVLARTLGADAIVSKPFRLDDLLKLARSTLDARPSQAPVGA